MEEFRNVVIILSVFGGIYLLVRWRYLRKQEDIQMSLALGKLYYGLRDSRKKDKEDKESKALKLKALETELAEAKLRIKELEALQGND